MKILGLAASPRKNGNTDLLLSALLAGAKAKGAETKKVYLADLDLAGCDACSACRRTGLCHRDDDLARLQAELLDADVWVLATPVYWWGPSLPAKALIDRWYNLCFGPNPKKIKGKKFALVSAFGDTPADATPFLKGMLKKSVAYLGLKWSGEVLTQALKKGEVKKNPAALKKAERLGAKLAG